MLEELIAKAKQQERNDRAKALRAIRRVDKPLAVLALSRWKNHIDPMKTLMANVMLYGTAAYRLEPVDDFTPRG